MEKGKVRVADDSISRSLQNLRIEPNSAASIAFQSTLLTFEKPKPPSLVSLCLGVVGRHIEDIVEDLGEIASSFPPDVKMAIAAIARRRRILNDDILIALAESSWEILDISDSDVSDYGFSKVVELCKSLRAVDISRCSKITSIGVSELVRRCQSLEILRWGGCPRSERTARTSMALLKPILYDMDGESWEELETTEIAHGANSLRWLVWPNIEKDSLGTLSSECPRINVNPKASLLGYRGVEVPREAIGGIVLDEDIVKEIDPKTWAVSGFTHRTSSKSVLRSYDELPIAEKFRLAFVARDERLAPKRAKNARQHQRRAQRERVTTSTSEKAISLATKSLRNWD